MAMIRLLIAANIAVIDSYDHTLILQRLISISIEFTEIFYSRRSIFLDILLMIRKESYKVHRVDSQRKLNQNKRFKHVHIN